MNARSLLVLCCAACSQAPTAPDAQEAEISFSSPQGLAVHSRYVVVANSAFGFTTAGEVVFGQGFVALIDKETLRVVGRVESTQKNPIEVVVHGDRAYVLNGGVTRIDAAGLAHAVEGGGIDVIDLGRDMPPAKLFNIPLGLSAEDARVGAYGSLALSPDGRRAFIGGGGRADFFEVDLEAQKVTRGPQQPIVVFPTAAGENGMVVVRALRDQLALLAFNHDALCLADYANVTDFRCRDIGSESELLEGPVDLAEQDDGGLLVLMTLANGLYAVEGTAPSAPVNARFAGTALAANAVRIDGEYAYVVNSLSHTLQRVRLADGASEPSFVAFAVGSNPYALAMDTADGEAYAWVTLFGHDAVARVELRGGNISYVQEGRLDAGEVVDGGAQGDAGTQADAGAQSDAEAQADAPCEASQVVGVEEVVEVSFGEGGGHNADALPEVVLGGPTGGGAAGGNASGVLSLGRGGEIVLGFGSYRLVDGPGPDLIVFENAFSASPYQSFAEPAVVGLSNALEEGSFIEFPCDLQTASGDPAAGLWPFPGCAGVRPVFANGEQNCVPADDALLAGGDAFDLAEIGVSEARYLRIRDGDQLGLGGEGMAGFDLDAVVLIHYRRVDP